MHRKPALYAACVAAAASLALSSAGTASADNHDHKGHMSARSEKGHHKHHQTRALLPSFKSRHKCREWGKKAVKGKLPHYDFEMKHFKCYKQEKHLFWIRPIQAPDKKSDKKHHGKRVHDKPQTLQPRYSSRLYRDSLESHPAERGKEVRSQGFREMAQMVTATAIVPSFESATQCQTQGNEWAQQGKLSYFSCSPLPTGAVVMENIRVP